MAPTDISPIRTKRLDEKASLQGLNNRLELYVLRVKEMEDAKVIAEKELNNLKARYSKEIENLKTRLNAELEETRKELDHEIDQKTRLQVLEQEQHQELTQLRVHAKQFNETKAIAERLQTELEKEKASAKNAKEALVSQGTQLQSARRQLKALEKDNRKLGSQLKDATLELETLRTENQELIQNRDQQLAELQQQLNSAHQDARLQWKDEVKERLEKAEKEVRQYYEGVIEGHTHQIRDYTTELETVRADLQRTTQDYDESLQIRQSLVDKLSNLEKEYRADRKKFKEDKAELEDNLEKSRQLRVTKEREFNDLMDIKIALDAEIRTYRSILDQEETRVGFSKPNTPASGHKRKSDKTPGSSKRIKASSSLRIHALNLEKDSVTLENISKQAVSLKGWQVCSESAKQIFSFPDDYTLKAGAKVIIHSGKKNKPSKKSIPKENEKMDVFWTKRYMWNNVGDAALLKDPQGNFVDRFAEGIIDEPMEDDSDLDFSKDVSPLKDNQCALM